MTVRRIAATLAIIGVTVLGAPAIATGAEDGPGPIATATTNATLTGDVMSAVVSPDGRTAYVQMWGARDKDPGTIAFVDTSKGSVTKTTKVGPLPVGLEITPDGKRLATSSRQDKAVTVVDAKSGKVVKKVAVGGQADALVIGPKGSSLFVYVFDQGYIAKIDLKSLTVKGRYPLKTKDGACRKETVGMADTPDSATLLVSCDESGLRLLSTATGRVVGSVAGVGGGAPVISKDGRLAYWGASVYVSVVDIARRKQIGDAMIQVKGDGSIDGIDSAIAFAAMPGGSKVYATMPDVGQVSILDPRSGEQSGRITLGGKTLFGAIGLTLSKDGSRLYVTQLDGGLVTVDTATDTVIGAEPGPDPTAASTDRTGAIPAVLLAGSRVGIGWATFPNEGPLKAAGLSILTMPGG